MNKKIILLICVVILPQIIQADIVEEIRMLKDLPEKTIQRKQYSGRLGSLFEKIRKNPALLAEGQEVIEKWKIDLNKKLLEAASKNILKEVTRITKIRPYIDVTWQDDRGISALHNAALFARKKILKILVERGADVNQKDKDGRTPLHYAAQGAKRDNMEYLLDKGGLKIINNQSNKGDTPLHVACAQGHVGAAKFLIDRGAAKNIKNKDGKTPYALAVAMGRGDDFKKLFEEDEPR